MSAKHLTSGSVEPPRATGLLRIYSMAFCPYAKRTRLVAKVKKLPHDIVNINLKNKPEWYFDIHPKGQVPSLLDEDQIIIESLDTVDYLDQKYPTDTPLNHSDPNLREKDHKLLRDNVNKITEHFGKIIYGTHTAEEALDILLPLIEPLERELAQKGTNYFGGDKPGIVDYMLWPWAELVPLLKAKLKVTKLPLADTQIPNLRKWAKTMAEVPAVKELLIPEKVLLEVAEMSKRNLLDYDEIGAKIPANIK